MKNLGITLLISIVWCLSICDCYAFDRNYKYNYEITDFSLVSNFGIISGWGILNAGVNDESNTQTHGSPYLNRDLESTESYPYDYSLRVYGVNVVGDYVRKVKYIKGETVAFGDNLSLTKVMCRKNSSMKCMDAQSPKYENVNYTFIVDFNDFTRQNAYVNSEFYNLSINGYYFELTIRSTQPNCQNSDDPSCSQTFPISFYENVVNDEAKRYFKTSTYLNTISFVANRAYLRSNSCGVGNTIYKVEKAGSNYALLERNDGCTGITYYKIKVGNITGWVPASYIAPLKGSYTLMQIQNDEYCINDPTEISFSSKSNYAATNSCTSNVSLMPTTTSKCNTQFGNEYYNFTCQDNISVQFIPSQEKYRQNDQFSIKAQITSYVSCYGQFDHVLWNTNRNKGDYSTTSLDQIKNSFLNFELNGYNTGVKSGTLQYRNNSNAFKTAYLYQTSSYTMPYENTSVTYTNGVPRTLNYQTDKHVTVLNLRTPMKVSDIKSREFLVNVSGLGYSHNSSANYSCVINLMDPVYRSIDLDDPFVYSNLGRETGINWQNSTFDFTGIIDEDIWKRYPEYTFEITTNNVKRIRQDTDLHGVSSYIGSQCVKGTSKYTCPFIRNRNYVSNYYIG